jgi:hypothetical protein
VATGLKCAARALLTDPLNAQFARELLLLLRRRAQLRTARRRMRLSL